MMHIRLKFSDQDLQKILHVVKTDYLNLAQFNQNYVTLVHNASEADLVKWKPLLQPPRMVVMFLCDVYWNPALQCVSVSWHGQDLRDMCGPEVTHLLPLRGSKGTFPSDCKTMVETNEGYNTSEAPLISFMGYVIAEAS